MSTPSCDGCGRCCFNQSSPPILLDEMDALPAALRAEIETYLSGPDYDDTKPCLWLNLDTLACKHYNHRPGVCRDYPLAGPHCHAERVAVGLTVKGWPLVPDDNH